MRIDHPAADGQDYGPADLAPAAPGEQPGTVAELICAIHQAKPLEGEALDGAKRFLGQWADGPQLPEVS